MKKILSLVLSVTCLFLLSACSNVHCVKQQHGYAYSLNQLWWTYRTELPRESQGETCLYYEATLTEGEINVYYDSGLLWDKELLFTIKAGETIKAQGGYVESEVDIIIEAISPASGSIYIAYANS